MSTFDQMLCRRCDQPPGRHGIYHSEPPADVRATLPFMEADFEGGTIRGMYCNAGDLDAAALRAVLAMALSATVTFSPNAADDVVVLYRDRAQGTEGVLGGPWAEVRAKLIDAGHEVVAARATP